MTEAPSPRQSESCDGCSHADGCKRAYEQLGQTGGPSIAWKATISFGVPIVVFAASLVGFEWLLREAVAAKYRTPLALLLAFLVAVGLMLIVSIATQRRFKRH
jgi:hypothetical protein